MAIDERQDETTSGGADGAPVGRHVVLDLFDVDPKRMRDAATETATLRRALTECGFHVLGDCWHAFDGGGATGLVLLSESHASFHTYPERRYIAFDLFGCGQADLEGLVERIVARWAPGRWTRHDLRRGGASEGG